jgi:hypothetical protein
MGANYIIGVSEMLREDAEARVCWWTAAFDPLRSLGRDDGG